jgi:putative flippase GtrA
VGIITFGLNYFFIWLFYGLLVLDYRVAVSIAFVVTVAAHFILSRIFVYKNTESPIAHHVWRYGIMLAINYTINLLASIITVEMFGLSPYFAVVFATAITACSSFFLMRYFVFF